MAANVHLTPELERFVRECVESGRYSSVSEAVCAGLRLLQRAENRRREFHGMLREAEAEADRDGTVTPSSVTAEIDAIISTSEQ